MPTYEIPDCGCDKTTNHVNLEEILTLPYCIECGGFHSGFQADIDGLISILEKLRETRVYGRRMRVAGQPGATVISTRPPNAEGR
jgi:hypothetical protein